MKMKIRGINERDGNGMADEILFLLEQAKEVLVYDRVSSTLLAVNVDCEYILYFHDNGDIQVTDIDADMVLNCIADFDSSVRYKVVTSTLEVEVEQ